MPQRYTLRLGDGTVVSADSDELATWAGDRRATAQAVGTHRWRPLHEVVAEEEAAARLALALVPPRPREEKTPQPPPPPPPVPPLELPEFDLGMEPTAFAARPSLQVLADNPEPEPTRYPESSTDLASDDMPAIPLKPLDDESAFESAFSDEEPEGEQAFREDEPRHDRLDGPLLTVLEKSGGFLSRWLERLTPFASRLTARQREAAGTSRDRPSPAVRVAAWLRGLRARVSRPADPEPPAQEREPARPAPPPERPAKLTAPTPLSELPALRLAEPREARQPIDVYAGGRTSLLESLRPLWIWTRRAVLAGALVVGGAYAVGERDTWVPEAANLGQTVFTEIDRLVLSRERSAEQRRALDAAAERLPQLAPETIRLVFTRSPIGVMQAPEVFQIASEAADRGLPALTPAAADELRGLRRELLRALSRTERERVREYDRTRTRRVIFPFENPHVMELVARGARALPPERLERLRALSHEAVAAGLAAPEPAVAAGAPH